jgi:hypothetical protein
MKEHDVARRQPRRDRLIRERVHDPYKARVKPPDPAVCPRCGAVYETGRWHWGPPPPGVAAQLCQACQRIEDDYPAGELTIAGGFVASHRDEIVNLARNQEALEKGERPLHRIMDIEETPDGFLIRTTDIHLPRRIGEALFRAFEGELDFHYEEEAYRIRVSWTRAA